jgi:hypothetical protein
MYSSQMEPGQDMNLKIDSDTLSPPGPVGAEYKPEVQPENFLLTRKLAPSRLRKLDAAPARRPPITLPVTRSPAAERRVTVYGHQA